MSPETLQSPSQWDPSAISNVGDESSLVQSKAASGTLRTGSLISAISAAWERCMTAYPMRLRNYEDTLQAVLLKATRQKFPGDGTHYLHLTNETMQCGVVLLRSRLPSQSWESLVVHIGRVEHWRLRNPVQETYNFDMKFDQRTCQITAIPSEEFVEVLIKAAE